MQQAFRRIAIVNRGEAAMRFIHAVREFNQEHGSDLRTIALYTEPDRRALFVREADEAYSIGPAHVLDAVTHQPKCSYVDYAKLGRALTEARVEAVWVGWGFVAEHADFADLCHELEIVFIGPSGDVMRKLGDKIAAKHLAEQAGIDVANWSRGSVETLADALHHGERLGYPLLIKATAGGGGRGIRRVLSPDHLPEAFESARTEAFKAFGNPTVLIEQVVRGARHVEVQVIADRYGTTWPLGVRDCSIQRRHQKIVEEAPSPALSIEQDRSLCDAAARLSQAAGYESAGTVEFLYEPGTHRFLFMEMNTRLQVEHPVTEATTGMDIVKMQIKIALGEPLMGAPPKTVGHAIEVRLNAEDPDNGFAPSPGKVERFRIPTGPGLRIDTAITEGDVIPSEFDSMIAKVIAFGGSRTEALARLQRALRESVVVIQGGASNKPFLLDLLSRAEVQDASADVGYLDHGNTARSRPRAGYPDIALMHAAIEAYEAERAIEQSEFYESALRGRPQVSNTVGRTIALRYRGNQYSVKVCRLGLQQYRISMRGASVKAKLERLGKYEYWLTARGRRFHVVSVVQGPNYMIEIDGVAHKVSRDDGGVVHSPAPAVVVSIPVRVGDDVRTGDRLVVLEAMKMEMEIVAPCAGKVRQVFAIPNVQVGTGAALLQIDPAAQQEHANRREVVVLGRSLPNELAPVENSRCEQNLEELKQFMLGFDVDPDQTQRLLAEWSQFCEVPDNCESIKGVETEILNIFVDLCSLFQGRRAIGHTFGGEAPSTESLMFSYLRMLATKGEGLPEDFVEWVRRAVAHYGVESLERSALLEESLFWIYKSHRRAEQQVPCILGVLERYLRRPIMLPENTQDEFRALLSRLISATRFSFPVISELARQVQYHYFDKHLFEHTRAEVYEKAENDLTYLDAHPHASDYHERIRALSDCPQPLASIFCRRFASASRALRELMLQILTSRFYRPQVLSDIRMLPEIGDCAAVAEYHGNAHATHLFATFSEYARLSDTARALLPHTQAFSADEEVVVDFYLWNAQPFTDPDSMERELRNVLISVEFPASVTRIVVGIAARARDGSVGGMQHFTYSRGESGYKEDELFRGVHPMIAQRLHYWRLKNFSIERLPSIEDVYLLHAVSINNPKDERLFAVAEVRDLTPVRNEAGKIVQLPHLERMFGEAVAGIRQYQAQRSSRNRLYWNRVLLYVWPPVDLKEEEWREIVGHLAPSTEGLGLEQVVVRARIPNPETGELRDMIVRISSPSGTDVLMTFRPASKLQPLKPLTEYDQKVVRMRQRGLIYPYEIIKMLTPSCDNTRAEFPPGEFAEYDLNAANQLAPVTRDYGLNKSNIIVGVIRNFTSRYPEGMSRVLVLGDPSKDLGALAEPECRRIIAALDLAQRIGIPVEWFPISAGAKISMNSGVENMDWIARVLRRIIEFTQTGGEVNVIVDGINVGAQPYWNAEATMLLHTRGILVMTPRAAMVLTGKRALDYSGSVSAEDNQGIGGYDRIMGPNGQSQYRAHDLNEACHILMRHYEHTYVAPGERFPRRAETTDPDGRNVCLYPHGASNGDGFALVGDVFSEATNPGRKKSFDIRRVMFAVSDQDHAPLERWAGMRSAENAVVWDAHLGGYPVCLIGIESRNLSRFGFVPADGPDQWTAGTLFPMSSKKIARAINSASSNRPVVILANLSGFDGSPESLRNLQLEYGAEIGRAVVNFKGPLVFCVVSRYHGGAYVVFSQTLNENLEVAALEGTFASVIGGAPAAAVVFSGEVESRTRADSRMVALNNAIAVADEDTKGKLRTEFDELYQVVYSEKLGEVASEFDRVHSVQRALQVGALHHIIPAANLRPYLIDAVMRGMAKTLVSLGMDTSKTGTEAEARAADVLTFGKAS